MGECDLDRPFIKPMVFYFLYHYVRSTHGVAEASHYIVAARLRDILFESLQHW